jgi:hypothetical protein
MIDPDFKTGLGQKPLDQLSVQNLLSLATGFNVSGPCINAR